MGKELRIVIKFSRDIPEVMLSKLKERMTDIDKIPEKIAKIFTLFDNVEVTIEYDKQSLDGSTTK